MSRIQYEIDDLLDNISGSEVGEDLTYSHIYDEIKQARYEEDDKLSQGVWKRDFVKADWIKVEKLCVQALKEQSKDLQIVAWLIEALTILDNIEGINKGINILRQFNNKYWDSCYPHKDIAQSDEDQKLRILEWIYEMTHHRIKLWPILGLFSLYDYDYALEIKNISIRNPEQSEKIAEASKNIKSIDDINLSIRNTDFSIIKKLFQQIHTVKTSIKDLNINQSFSKLLNDLNKIEKLFNEKAQIANTTSNHEEYKSQLLTRDEIYKAIEMLSVQLEKIEKHSPSPYLLKLAISWKDKNLLEIMDDLHNGSSPSHRLLKMLMS